MNEHTTKTKIALVTLFDSGMEEVGTLTSCRMDQYANKHGYRFVCHSALLDPSLHPSWNKLLAIKRCFADQRPDWAFWIDADALLLNLNHPVANLINEQFDILFGSDFNGLSAGVMLLKNCEWTISFLDCALFVGDIGFDPDGFGYKAEQNTFKQLILSFPQVGRHVALVEQRLMNSYLDNYANSDLILHLHSLSNEKRLEIMRAKILELDHQRPFRVPV